ncbi:MAG: hypothetical protein LBT42_00890 [Tannerella sp.]|jgi:hypothetical protein|nr:hypothetical protein [Tannerella sp.]
MKKKRVIKALSAAVAMIVIATVVAYFMYETEKPWMALYIACCGGVLVVNLIISIIFVNKNLGDKREN